MGWATSRRCAALWWSASNHGLRPGEAFEYTSWCVIATPSGEMRGSYQMVTDAGGTLRRRHRPLPPRNAPERATQLRRARVSPIPTTRIELVGLRCPTPARHRPSRTRSPGETISFALGAWCMGDRRGTRAPCLKRFAAWAIAAFTPQYKASRRSGVAALRKRHDGHPRAAPWRCRRGRAAGDGEGDDALASTSRATLQTPRAIASCCV